MGEAITSAAKAGKHDHGRLTVTVYDEDAGGDPLTFDFGPGEKVQKAIDALYDALNTSPGREDRLLCEASGEAVGPHATEHLRDYATGTCAALVWTFARGTGGA